MKTFLTLSFLALGLTIGCSPNSVVRLSESFKNSERNTLYLVVPLKPGEKLKNVSSDLHEIEPGNALNTSDLIVIVADDDVSVTQGQDSWTITVRGRNPNITRSQDHFMIMTREEILEILVHETNIEDLKLKWHAAYSKNWQLEQIDNDVLQEDLRQLDRKIAEIDQAIGSNDQGIDELDKELDKQR